jgi:protocatechuate 3,4-dioxygenase beta subunit
MDPRGRVIGSSRTPIVDNGGVISGRVLGSDARPVGGAFVILTAGIEGARETTTDYEGRYEFSGLPAGAYRVTAAKLGTALTMRDRPAEVALSERQALSGINIAMQRPSAVTGTVVDHHGEPMEGLTVELWRPVASEGRRVLRRPEAVTRRRTDDRGRYRLFRVMAGEYFVTAGEEPRVRREVVDGPDSSLRAYYPGTSVVAEAVAVRVATGLDASGIDITYAPPTGARVYGSAFDSRGQPLRYPVTLIESSRSGRPIQAERTARVRDDGGFEFLNVPPGDYVVQATLRPTPGRAREFGVGLVTVAGLDAPPITLRTSRGTRVRGRVIFEGDMTRVRPDSFGIAAYPNDPAFSEMGMDGPSSGIEDDGTVELYLQGPMRITSSAVPEGWWLKSATVGSVDAAEEPYTFAANGPAVAMTLVFADAAPEISGRVVDERGRVVRDSFVLAFSTEPARWLTRSRYVKGRRPDANGAFRVSGLPPGDYWIVAVDRIEQSELQDADALATLARAAERITLYERQRLVRDLRLVQR